MDKPLLGQSAIITGASGGLGTHFAKLLAGAGAAVALTARRLDMVEDLAGEIAGSGGRAMAMRLDVADAASIAPTFAEIEAALGPVSILVNNAGVGGEGLALDLSVEDWDRTFDVNVRGVFFAAQAAARLMLANGTADAGQGLDHVQPPGGQGDRRAGPGQQLGEVAPEPAGGPGDDGRLARKRLVHGNAPHP